MQEENTRKMFIYQGKVSRSLNIFNMIFIIFIISTFSMFSIYDIIQNKMFNHHEEVRLSLNKYDINMISNLFIITFNIFNKISFNINVSDEGEV